jgi:hypothetical protein
VVCQCRCTHTLVAAFAKIFKKILTRFELRAFSKLDLSEYDLVISSSGAEAKAVKTGQKLNTLHIVTLQLIIIGAVMMNIWKEPRDLAHLIPFARLSLGTLNRPMRNAGITRPRRSQIILLPIPNTLKPKLKNTMGDILWLFTRQSILKDLNQKKQAAMAF